ncbi:MAG TPA: hypothetical protein VFA94_13370 [Acidimicrobiales bacterium]|nr:hypothetical protein [Acidimicrobiales bacterium]
MDDELLARLRIWSADAAAADATAQRRRARSLAEQAGASATLAGLARDWAEQGADVVVRVRGGRSVRGRVAAAGCDFLALGGGDDLGSGGGGGIGGGTIGSGIGGGTSGGEALRLVPLAAVVLVHAGGGTAGGPVRPPLTTALVDVLCELAAERPVVHVRVDASRSGVRGRLRAAGEDVLTLVVEDGERSVVHVPLAAVCEVAVVG